MNKIISFVLAVMATALTVSAETFRVNNVPGSGAQFTNFADAQDAASDGDVIIFDGSKTSYGKIEVSKKLTIKGPGFFLEENGKTTEGYECAEFDNIDVNAAGAVISGVVVDTYSGGINLKADDIVITRCYVSYISLCESYSYTEQSISNCIIHQNYIFGRIEGDHYSAPANYIQVTNNVMLGVTFIGNMNQSVISHNTIVFRYDVDYRQLSDCVFEYNLCPKPGTGYGNENITFRENIETATLYYSPYKDCKFDGDVKEVDLTQQPTPGVVSHGAFSGDSPYVLSGLTTGPRIEDLEMPATVVQGQDMKVTVKISVAQ